MVALLPEIRNALERGATILTANQRVARTIERAFDNSSRAAGHGSWLRPNIFPVDVWLSSLWQHLLLDGAEGRLLLNRAQEQAVWRQVIAADTASEPPALASIERSIDLFATTAARAWQMVCLHGGRARLKEAGVSVDTRAFQRWAAEFERRCKRAGYLTRAQLPAALEDGLANGRLALPDAGVSLVDVDDVAPSTLQFFHSLERAGYPVEQIRTGTPATTAHLLATADEAEELRALTDWVHARRAAHPSASVAILFTGSTERQQSVERALRATDAAEFSPWHTFIKKPLTATPAVAIALDLLRWSFEPLPLERVSALVLSPFFGSARGEIETGSEGRGELFETFTIAAFDAYELHRLKLLRPELTLAAMIDGVEGSHDKWNIPSLRNRLKSVERVAAREQMSSVAPGVAAPRQSHAGWAEAFRTVLDAAGWTQATQADPVAAQARQRWERVLDTLATLDFEGKQIDAMEAHATLERMLADAVFSPDTSAAPLEILSPNELGGTTFDALWMLGADDLAWPQTPALNPLLPLQLQRSLGVPGAVPAADLRRAQSLTHRIVAAAREVVFSFAQHGDDGERQPSPLLQELGLGMLPSVARTRGRMPRSMTSIADDAPLPPLPERVLRGGAQILAAQAACGFRAFAEWRLWSSPPETPELGMNARERGSLVHTIMERFWGQVHDQLALAAMPRTAREELLRECIDAAVNKGRQAISTTWDDAYLRTQTRRLEGLLAPWLNLELHRPAFQVRERECKLEGVIIGPLKLTVRVDRIDNTASGSLILDYKTGPATPADWLSDRPDAPQLPLYAVLAQAEQLGGVAFALLRAGEELGLKGFADDPAVLERSSRMQAATLEAQVAEWRRILTGLAIAFAEGDAAVAPKCYPKTCNTCAQRILCRLDPTNLDEDGDEDEALSFVPGTSAGSDG